MRHILDQGSLFNSSVEIKPHMTVILMLSDVAAHLADALCYKLFIIYRPLNSAIHT